MSRYGWISLSLMYFQMIRVISSPSISTTGLATLILFIGDLFTCTNGLKWRDRAKPSRAGGRRYSIQSCAEKAEVYGGQTIVKCFPINIHALRVTVNGVSRRMTNIPTFRQDGEAPAHARTCDRANGSWIFHERCCANTHSGQTIPVHRVHR